jgi:serine/threonine protein phosphatase PrpC
VAPPGAQLAGGVVVSSDGFEEHLVRMGAEATWLVAFGPPEALEREADALALVGTAAPFARVVEFGVDPIYGTYLALVAPPADARRVGDSSAAATFPAAMHVVEALVDAARVVERIGFAWEPQRGDLHVLPDGSLRIARMRVPRKLAPGERLDVRAVVEAMGSAFVPVPAMEGPPRAFRLLLPHASFDGRSGSTFEAVRAELAAIASELEVPADEGAVAGICDPGLRRPRNEDACAFKTGVWEGHPWSVLVVCDGVSSSSNAGEAARMAAKFACHDLAKRVREGGATHPEHAVAEAICAAHVEVCGGKLTAPGDDLPGTTIVVALVWRRRVTVGWLGDSRAYWVSPEAPTQLTHDHSWAAEVLARGEATEEEVGDSPMAHALTRCLGPLDLARPSEGDGRDGASGLPRVNPEVRGQDLDGAGYVVLCSDGFWNYCPQATDVGALVDALGESASASRVARRLVNHALARGGHDNVTVLVHRVE